MPGTIAAMPRSIERPVEAHLGDVIGSIAPPMSVRRVVRKHPRWIEDGTSLLIAWIATVAFAPLVALAVWITFTFGGRSPLE